MSSKPFGEHLRREREMRGVSLEEISAATRISTRFLEAIERDQWNQLPGGVFNRGFIRAVARFLGLDEDSLVAEYALETCDVVPPRVAPEYSDVSSGRPWLAFAIFGVLIAALVAGSWFAIARFGPRLGALFHGRHTASTTAAQKPITYSDTIVTRSGPDPFPGAPASGDPAAAGKSIATAASTALELKLEAGKSSEVRIIADGMTIFDGHIEAGETKQLNARESFEISSSEASALFLELNGQTLPPIGTPGQVGNVTLTRRDLRTADGGAH